MKVLALDPATRTGFAHSDGTSGVWCLTKSCLPGEHLVKLRRHILEFLVEHETDDIAYEEASFASINLHTSAFHNRLAGVIESVAYETGCNCHAINPATWKATMAGSGRAKKPQTLRAAVTLYGQQFASDDECDAFLILKFVEQRLHLRTPRAAKRVERVRRKKEPKLF